MLLYPMETLDTSSYTMGSNLRKFVGLKVLLESTFNYIKKHKRMSIVYKSYWIDYTGEDLKPHPVGVLVPNL